MELRQLEYYVAVVQHGSILQAASALNLSQPPLSVAMKQLEQELGTPLFFRGARRIFYQKCETVKEQAKSCLDKGEKEHKKTDLSEVVKLRSQERALV